jgi:hypothetical protein
MPVAARGVETIEGLVNNKYVAFKGTKFRACNDIDSLGGDSFKVGVANVSGPCLQIIQLSKEDK